MNKQQERFLELDTLRVVGLLLILLSHCTGYIINTPLTQWITRGVNYTGLGLFVFLSGFGLQHSLLVKEGQIPFRPIAFLKKRLARIYPLYLIALIAFVVVFHFLNIYHSWKIEPVVESFLIHLFSLQVLVFPIYPQMNTLWFIGMIVPLYILFALTANNKTAKFVLFQSAIFATILSLNLAFKVIDFRLILYYPFFIVGCLCSRNRVLPLKLSQDSKLLLPGLVISTAGVYWAMRSLKVIAVNPAGIKTLSHLVGYGFAIVYITLSISTLVVMVYQFSGIFQRFPKLIVYLSNLSYPVYLFHRIVYGIFYYLILDVLGWSRKTGTFLFPLITVVVFLFSYLIVRWETSFLRKRKPEDPAEKQTKSRSKLDAELAKFK